MAKPKKGKKGKPEKGLKGDFDHLKGDEARKRVLLLNERLWKSQK
jgi:hypothetical protein